MEQWWLGLPGSVQGAVVSIVLLPYVGIISGMLVPKWVVQRIVAGADAMTEIWKGLYTDSEGVRVRAVEAMERGADSMQDSAALVKAVIDPLRKHALRDDAT